MINLPTLANRVLLESSETDKYNTFSFNTGYGQVAKGGAKATLGASVVVKVQAKVHAVISNKIEEKFQEIAKKYNLESQYKKVHEQYGGGGRLGFFLGCFSVFGGGGYNKESEHVEQHVNSSSTQAQKDLLNEISSTTATDLTVSGEIIVTGFSMIPSEANVWIEVMTVKGYDQTGKSVDLKVVSATPNSAVADSNGNVTGQGKGTLNAVQL